MINKAILVGRLGADPEVRYATNGNMVTSFQVATDESYKNKSGEKVQKTEWHRIVIWGKLAEIAAQYTHKGDLVYIEGKIQSRSWDDKDGNKRTTTEILASALRILSGKKEQPAGPPEDEDVPF